MTDADFVLSTPLPVPPSIAAQVKGCLGCFDALLVDLNARDEYRSLSRAISDASGRFKIWSSNIGAHRDGRRSLDHRLRDASHLQEHVLRLLSGLIENLSGAREISSGGRVPWDQLQFSDSDLDDSEDEEDTKTEPILPQELQHKTEMDQILAGIDEAITNLLRLSAAIRNPARHDQWLNFSKSLNTTPFEQFDIAHVAAKYPHISGNLARRLGTALSRRRCYFKYREEHHNKMAAGLTVEEQDGKSTIASSLPDKQKISAVNVSMLGDDDNQSEGGFTATSFATSVAGTAALRIPPLPLDANYDKHFECPFCYDIIIVKDRSAWKQHVYSDLQPYMCLRENCSLGRRMFSTRHEWLQHEQNYHGRAWTCCLGCLDPFDDRQSMQDHYLSHHSAQTQGQIDKVLQASETQRSDTRPYTCPLCSKIVSTTKAYAKHAGRHLRELSLFALPAYATDDVLADGDSENKSKRENAILDDTSETESGRESAIADDDSETESGRESAIADKYIEERNRLTASTEAQMALEREATLQRERQEMAAQFRQQQSTSEYWDPRGGDRFPIPNNGPVRRGSVSGRRASLSTNAPPTGLGRSNSNRRVSIIQPTPPPIENYSRPHSARHPSYTQENPFAQPPRRISADSQENPFAQSHSARHSPPIASRDPWDIRNMHEALPQTQQVANNRHGFRRQGEDVINRTANKDHPRGHSRAQEATRNIGKAVGFEDDYKSSSENEEDKIAGFGARLGMGKGVKRRNVQPTRHISADSRENPFAQPDGAESNAWDGPREFKFMDNVTRMDNESNPSVRTEQNSLNSSPRSSPRGRSRRIPGEGPLDDDIAKQGRSLSRSAHYRHDESPSHDYDGQLHYQQAVRGSNDPFNEQVHKAAKRASPVLSGPSDSNSSRSKGSDGKSRISQSNRTIVTNSEVGEIRLRVDASAPLNLQFNGDMDGRTLRIDPAEGGMADVVIGGNQRSNESTYRSEKGSITGGSRKSVAANQARREAEESSVRSGSTRQSRRDGERRVLRRRRDTEYN